MTEIKETYTYIFLRGMCVRDKFTRVKKCVDTCTRERDSNPLKKWLTMMHRSRTGVGNTS